LPKETGTLTSLDKAISLAQRGLPVFFCSRSKRPTLEGGFYNATTDIAALRLLYEKAPGDLIGVPCGLKFVVVDPDLQHRAARQWLKSNKRRIAVTRTHRTASGGLHFFFKPHRRFRTNIAVHQNVDTRGLGSYIIWWPAEGLPVFNRNALAEVPDWIIDAMPPEPPRRHRCDIMIDQPATPIDSYLAEVSSPEAAFTGILKKMASARPGVRQCLAFWCANRTFELIREGGLDHDDAIQALEQVALSTGLEPRQVHEVLRRVGRAVLA
jgi:hypothetical protein